MEDYPTTLLEFEKRFATGETCRQYFLKLRWPKGFRCPNCGNKKAWLTDRKLYHCGNRDTMIPSRFIEKLQNNDVTYCYQIDFSLINKV